MRNGLNYVPWKTDPGRYTMVLKHGDVTTNIVKPSKYLYGPMRIEYRVHKDGGIDATFHDYRAEDQE